MNLIKLRGWFPLISYYLYDIQSVKFCPVLSQRNSHDALYLYAGDLAPFVESKEKRVKGGDAGQNAPPGVNPCHSYIQESM